MSEEQYLENRVNKQINWYSSKSSNIKKKFFTIQVIEIIIAGIITALSKFSFENEHIADIITILSIVVIIFSSLRNLFKWQDLWIKYRYTAELLKREKFLFLTRTNIYINENAFNLFTERIEDILNRENENWTELNLNS
ncbi:DUF4231 domain-containing protein [Clostridioides difficile]|nr:DUF4231 domain-containing protein [Clostridioides difficile]QGZ13315.1 hypothetical protein phiCDKH01_16 [Clostridium phage phiCDKH01]EGT3679872.1 DUF4231 domain-containing protein [Clostridioides difficile]EGT3796267.1 DUF4231 domain-containing protein [Clostridioides difficile]EGT3809558.1 DUF4231 domain-containing protein [Clostridioides difficile]EGT3864819.1 DUF4231 domain-containing protein [Clostridioides difficile]